MRIGPSLALCGLLLAAPAAAIDQKDDTEYIGKVKQHCDPSVLEELHGYVQDRARPDMVRYLFDLGKKSSWTATTQFDGVDYTMEFVDYPKKADTLTFLVGDKKIVDENLDCRVNFFSGPDSEGFNTLESAGSAFSISTKGMLHGNYAFSNPNGEGALDRYMSLYRGEEYKGE